MAANRIKAQIGDEIWNSYFKFCVVRDPFEKAVSAFYHYRRSREISRTKGDHQSRIRRIKGFFLSEPKFDSVREEFEHWLKSGAMVLDRDKYMIGDSFCLDEVIRYESLRDDMGRICKKIGVEFDPSRLPSFKTGIRDKNVTLSEIYSRRSLEIVAGLYAYEMERFAYAPPALA